MAIAKTVRVFQLESDNTILMEWDHLIYREDVRPAFDAIVQFLDAAPHPLYVVVDIRSNPQFPLSLTVNGALNGPAGHPKLKGWLVIGKNVLAHVIARTLNTLTGKQNIHWFSNYDAALGFIEQEQAVSG